MTLDTAVNLTSGMMALAFIQQSLELGQVEALKSGCGHKCLPAVAQEYALGRPLCLLKTND